MAQESKQPQLDRTENRTEKVVREDDHIKITHYSDGTVRKDRKLTRPPQAQDE